MSTIYTTNSISRMSLQEQTWESLFQKGKICQEDSDNVEAILYYKLSLEQYLKNNVGENLENVKILKSLIRLCYDQSRFSQSLQYATQLKTLLEKNKINTQDYAYAFERISGTYYVLGHLKDAEKSYLKTIPLYEKLKGNDSIEVAGLRTYLGQVYHKYSQIDIALEEYEKSQSICLNRSQQIFSVQLAKIYSQKAQIYRVKSDSFKSFDYVQKSMKILSSLGRQQTSDYCANLICAVQLYLSHKQIKDAQEGLSKLKEITKKIKGIQSIDYANALILEANLFITLGSYKGGVDFYTRALKIIENIYGKESLYTNNPLDGLSIAYEKLTFKQQAIRYASLFDNLKFIKQQTVYNLLSS